MENQKDVTVSMNETEDILVVKNLKKHLTNREN